MEDEASIVCPELAGEVRKAWRDLDKLANPTARRDIQKEVSSHFAALEKVLALLHGRGDALYQQAMQSYLTMQLAVLRGKAAQTMALKAYLLL